MLKFAPIYQVILSLLMSGFGLCLTATEITKDDDQKTSVLFTLGRSPDPNEIIYEINRRETGEIDPKDPVKEYWLRHTEGGITKALTWPQRHFGFGMKVDEAADSIFTCHFAAYKKRTLTIRPYKGRMKAFIESKGKQMILDSVFLQVEGGSFWLPNVTKATLHLTNPQTCRSEIEIIIP